MKTVALYLRVSSVDQHPETQLYDLRAMAQQRGFQIVAEYTDRISGTKARRPGLDDLLRRSAILRRVGEPTNLARCGLYRWRNGWTRYHLLRHPRRRLRVLSPSCIAMQYVTSGSL